MLNKRLPTFVIFILAAAAIGIGYGVLHVVKPSNLAAIAATYAGVFGAAAAAATFFTEASLALAALAFVGGAIGNGILIFVLVGKMPVFGMVITALAFFGALVGGLGGVFSGRKVQQNLAASKQLFAKRA